MLFKNTWNFQYFFLEKILYYLIITTQNVIKMGASAPNFWKVLSNYTNLSQTGMKAKYIKQIYEFIDKFLQNPLIDSISSFLLVRRRFRY